MSLSVAEKQKIMADYQTKEADTGSVEVQVALLTEDIKKLTGYFKENKHDYHSKQGLMAKVNNRRKLLRYLKNRDVDRYRQLIKRLELRDVQS